MWIPRPRSAGKAGSKAKGKGAGSRDARDTRDGSEARGMRTDSEVVTRTSQHESSATIRPMLPNNGAMSTFVGAFDVTSKLTGKAYQCRFSHMWNGIATRHADTIDTKFYVDGEAHVVGLAHPAFVTFRERSGRDLTDREASFVSAEYLRERLEEEDERPLYDVFYDEVLRLIEQVGIK
jgi:hypothetical protein